ncbi:hypothetical protein ACLMJK_009567 [Lecanora helva]
MIGIIAACLDVSTDVLLIAIPVCLLWTVHIKASEKLGIGAFLCLSIVMISFAIVKSARIETYLKSFDLIWQLFWAQVEACSAVLAVSLSAFRSIFVSNRQRTCQKKDQRNRFQRLQTWFSLRNGTVDGDTIHPTSPHNVNAPHVTLGMIFQSAQLESLWNSPIQHTPHLTTTPNLEDLEDGLQTISHDSTTRTQGSSDTGESMLNSNRVYCHEEGSDALSVRDVRE